MFCIKLLFPAIALLISAINVSATLFGNDLPVCFGNSVCGFLQVNDRGITTTKYCECNNNLSCPLTWDPIDGRTVMQGIQDQYKFCSHSPQISNCNSESADAYVSIKYFVMPELESPERASVIGVHDNPQCHCEGSHTYGNPKIKFYRDPINRHVEVVKLSYSCEKFPQCKPKDNCKLISDSTDQYLVSTKCICPFPMACPTNTTRQKRSFIKGQTKFTKIYCQMPEDISNENDVGDDIENNGTNHDSISTHIRDNSFYATRSKFPIYQYLAFLTEKRLRHFSQPTTPLMKLNN